MNKRGLRLILIFLAVLTASAIVVIAADDSMIGKFSETIQGVGKFFGVFNNLGPYGLKFMLWLTLFVLVQYGLKKADFDGKVSGTIGFTLATATVVLIKDTAIQKIFQLYAHLVVLALGLIVPMILFWIIHKSFSSEEDQDALGPTVIRTILYFVMGGVLMWFSANAADLMGVYV